jgi:chromosome segregation ATPase
MLSPHSINFPDDPDPLARYRREQEQQEEEFARKRRQEERERQRTQAQQAAATNDYWAQVDARIEEKFNLALDVAGEAIGIERGTFQQALRRRDAEIRLLRRELRTLRNELDTKLNLQAEVAAARGEIEALRARAPTFEHQLSGLQEQIDKQQKTISKLRVENSQLAFTQKELDGELSQMKRNSAAPAAVVEFETSSSRITVGNLHPDAANALREFASQVVDAYDGDPILFSGPAGTA